MTHKEIVNDQVVISKRCTATNEIYKVEVPVTLYNRYTNGQELIQDIFPDLTRDQREFIISGWTPDEWMNMFGEMED